MCCFFWVLETGVVLTGIGFETRTVKKAKQDGVSSSKYSVNLEYPISPNIPSKFFSIKILKYIP